MSTTQNNRGENVMHSIVEAMNLSIYTTHICANKNVFSPDNDFNGVTVARIVDTAMEIYMNCFEANGVYARKNTPYFEENMQERIRLQRKAIQNCNELLALAYLAKRQFHLPLRKLNYWSKLILNVKRLIVGWNESDIQRLKS